MTFGEALECLKSGKRVARSGWNGKGMWLVLLRGEKQGSVSNHGVYNVSPCIAMKTAGGDLQPGWLANQPDMLSSDWSVVE